MIVADDVAKWGDLQLDAEGTAQLGRVVDAVLAHAAAHYAIPETINPEANADLWLGLTMQAARLWGRRNSPDGVAAFGESFVVRVGRFDPDIDAMLDRYRTWAVG